MERDMAEPSAARRSSIDDLAGRLLKKAAAEGYLDGVKGIIQLLGIPDGELAAVFYYFMVLHWAAHHGHLDVCKYLVEELGADVNMAGPDKGFTPLIATAMSESDHVSIVKYLLDRGTDPMKSDKNGSTALHHAAGSGSSKVTEFLLSKGVPVDIDFNGRGTPLLSAAICKEDKTLQILLDHHANPNTVFLGSGTPLMSALLSRSLKCMELLIKAGADVNGKGSFTSPLIVAIGQGGFINFIEFLLKAGADPNIPDNLGRLPIEVAELEDHREEVEILFPLTSPIPNVPNWDIDGVISHAKLKHAEETVLEGKKANAKAVADKAFRNKGYEFASDVYGMVLRCGPDATLYSNRSLCKLKMGDGAGALLDANQCRMMRPDWAKACYSQASAHMLLKDYKQACDALLDAKKNGSSK